MKESDLDKANNKPRRIRKPRKPKPATKPTCVKTEIESDEKIVDPKDILLTREEANKIISEFKDEVVKEAKSESQKYEDYNMLQVKKADLEAVYALTTEFMDDFIIVGHTVGGERVVINYANTAVNYDGLQELCKQVFMSMVQGGQKPS